MIAGKMKVGIMTLDDLSLDKITCCPKDLLYFPSSVHFYLKVTKFDDAIFQQ